MQVNFIQIINDQTMGDQLEMLTATNLYVSGKHSYEL